MSNNVFGTYEWATHTINILDGCFHDCKYCYSKEMAIRFKRKTHDNWKCEKLRNYKLNIPQNSGVVMFPSSHDISPYFLDEEINVIRLLIEKDKNILLVTKPHYSVIKRICEEFNSHKTQIKFRFSIGSANNDILKFWEPNAPDFQERLQALQYAYNDGFGTSISCEPMLDNRTLELVTLTEKFINDTIWIGKPNFLLRRLKVNGFNESSAEFQAGKELLSKLDDDYIKDLYNLLIENSKIRWKESIKKVLGIEQPLHPGLDV